MTFLRFLVAGSTLLYVTSAIGVLVAHRLFRESLGWIALAGELTVLVFLPLPALLLLALVVRSRMSLVLLLAPALAFGTMYGPLFLPDGAKPAGGSTLVVRSHNLLWGNRDVAAEVRAIEAQRPDVVLFQEISQPVADELARRLQVGYSYQALDAETGMGIVSRYPMEYRGCRQPTPRSRCWQHAVIKTGGQSVNIVNVHGHHPSIRRRGSSGVRAFLPQVENLGIRDTEMRDLIEWIGALPGPVVVAGDFNMSPHSTGYQIVSEKLVDVHRAVGWGFGHTFPADLSLSGFDVPPLVRIDYIFVSPGIVPVRSEVDEPGGSDHLAITATLALSARVAWLDARRSARLVFRSRGPTRSPDG